MAENVSEAEILFSRIEIRHTPIVLVEEVETVTKSVCGDYVACVRFKNCVQVQNLAILWARFAPSREHLFQTLLDNRLDSTDAGIGEESVDAVPAHTVYVVAYRGNDRIWGWRE